MRGHSTDSHMDAKGMRTFNQVNANRAEAVQDTQVHGLPRAGPETMHDWLSHLAQSDLLGRATPNGEQTIGEMVAVVLRILLDVPPLNEGHEQAVNGAFPQTELLGYFGQTHWLGGPQRLQDGYGALDRGNGIRSRCAWRHDRTPARLAGGYRKTHQRR